MPNLPPHGGKVLDLTPRIQANDRAAKIAHHISAELSNIPGTFEDYITALMLVGHALKLIALESGVSEEVVAEKVRAAQQRAQEYKVT